LFFEAKGSPIGLTPLYALIKRLKVFVCPDL